MDHDEYWQAVLRRDAAYDGEFVFAVRSTGIYCRPSCPARRPGREQVAFYPRPAQAEAAGFRACRRCHPDGAAVEPHLDLIREVCTYLSEPHDTPPTLDELAGRFHLSPYHLQRTFKRLVGVTPRQYAAQQRQERLQHGLIAGQSVAVALYGAGYGSPGAIYRQNGEGLGMTPTQYQQGGEHMDITYTITESPLGKLLVAATERGVCAVKLGDDGAELEAILRRQFARATLRRDDGALGAWVKALLAYLAGGQPHLDLPLDVQATAFQRRVWQALREIPYGATRTYTEIAAAIGQPAAVRAVANACGANPVALVIPCHRVVRQDGTLGGYRWGLERKKALLAAETGAKDREPA